MSFHVPPTLQSLAVQSLLKNEALAMSALQELPRVLFPPLFKEAFTGRHTKILKAMVASWPFPCLPVGALMKFPDMMILQAVLDGVDMQLTRNFHPRRQKLQVLDLRNVHHAFWDISAGPEDGDRSAETVCEKQIPTRLHRYALRQRLKVVTDLCLEFDLDEYQTYFLQWAQKRRGSLNLCCVKMQIKELSMYTVRKVLKIFQPDCIVELELNTGWTLPTLACFAPSLGQMKNLRKLLLTLVDEKLFSFLFMSTDKHEKRITKLISQFSKFNCLRHLNMVGVYFLKDHLNDLFRCLKTPLEFLSITLCKFSQSDLESFAQCQSLHHLKHLHLSGIILCDLSLVPLRILLEKVTDTLKTLELEHCRMTDSQLSALFPALSRCSQLIEVNFYDNDISMAVLRKLLHHTTNLRQLNVEYYPAPLECYEIGFVVRAGTFSQLSSELMDTLCTVRQPQSVSFASQTCLQCLQRCIYDMETRLCHCWQ
ncbi:preferentially expressed antigen in melanoma-like protein 7 [Grammomys surdaster]|uniref:preferentially expressed antigen in melanoma-like protein 7 n=1 Tax=Grammomys surdaster TaxID=491861 RepID=UPI00109F441A|nr:preferentially expressed antigen in melanoma-like protein 7 [Grammomys surdaster]